MKEPSQPKQDQDHPLRNDEEITRILLRGTGEELDALRAFHGLSVEELKRRQRAIQRREDRDRKERDVIRSKEIFGRSEDGHARLTSQAELDELLQGSLKEAQMIVASLSNEQRQAISNVKRLPVSPEDAHMLMLVISGVKPAAMISVPAKQVIAIRTFCTSHGLHLDAGIDESVRGRERIMIARDPVVIEQLKGLSPAKDHEAFGRLMGFPPTAIEGFVTRRLLETREHEVDPAIIVPMRLSQAHWPEELRLVARWSYIIKLLEQQDSTPK